MSKRVLTIAFAAALLVAACSKAPQTTIDLGSGTEFVPYVVDTLANVGFGNAVAVASDGTPYFSYFGVPAQVAKGETPPNRPLGSAYVPGVLLASVNDKGIWTRGGVAQSFATPNGVYVPYGPAVVKSLADLTQANANGTAVAIGSDGSLHVVWTGPDGVWYAKGGGTSAFSAEHVYNQTPTLSTAGPVGPPSIALDAQGAPIVAFEVVRNGGPEVDVAVTQGGKWKVKRVAKLSACDGCTAGGAVIESTAAGLVIVFADQGANAVKGAVPGTGKKGWSIEIVEAGVSGNGLSAANDKDGHVHAAYYTGSGAVDTATNASGSWIASKAQDAAPPADGSRETTGIAVDDAGTQYLSWYDGTAKAVMLASSTDGTSWKQANTPQTNGGTQPSVGVTPDGKKVYLAWYNPIPTVNGQSLTVGIEASVQGLSLAAPSPLSTASLAPASPAGQCGSNGKLVLDEVAKNIAFQVPCLVAKAGDVKVNFDNQDAGTPHNMAVFTSSDLKTPVGKPGQIITGPAKATFDFGTIKAGTYFFHCDVHPTTMSGTLVVI